MFVCLLNELRNYRNCIEELDELEELQIFSVIYEREQL